MSDPLKSGGVTLRYAQGKKPSLHEENEAMRSGNIRRSKGIARGLRKRVEN